jgi:hypothetical protein
MAAGRLPTVADIDLLRNKALPEERDLELDDLARHIAQRTMGVLEVQ